MAVRPQVLQTPGGAVPDEKAQPVVPEGRVIFPNRFAADSVISEASEISSRFSHASLLPASDAKHHADFLSIHGTVPLQCGEDADRRRRRARPLPAAKPAVPKPMPPLAL